MEAHYTPEQMKQFEELGKKVPTAEREALERRWTDLMAEVRASTHLDPASPEAQALGERWNAMTAETARYYQEYPELWAAIGDNYRQGAFEGHEHAPQAADFEWIAKVNAARPASS
jgi:hypothetical protein